MYPLLNGDQFVCIITHLILLYLLLKLSNKVFLNRQIPLQNSHCFLQHQFNVGTHTTNLTSHALTVISFGFKVWYHPWLYWKFVLGKNFLRISDFGEGLASILLITSLSKDRVPSVEKPYADFISYGNVYKLSPIESIKTKRCLLLGTEYFGNTQPLQHLFHFRATHFRAPRNWSIFKSNFYQLECYNQIGFSSIWKLCVLIYQYPGFINCI